MYKPNYLILIPIIVFYGAYITKAILLNKRQGISVNRLGRGEKATYTRILEIFLIIITLSMLVLQLLSVFNVFPILNIGKYNKIIGFIIAFVGAIIFVMALIAMKNSWRAGIDKTQNTSLRTSGILKLSRNPAFLGFDLFYIGVAYANPNIIIFVMVLVSLILFHLQILEEEKFLSIIFGDDYRAYKEKVRRYV